MPTYGVTSTGFRAKPLSVILDELDDALKLILGDSAGTEPDGTIPPGSYAGQLKALIADLLSALWDLAELAYASYDPSKATGAALDSVASITGSRREDARQSTVPVVCVGTANTALSPFRVAKVTSTGKRFVSPDSTLTIAALSAWVTATVYAKGDLVTRGGNIYYCTTAGTSSAGPSGTSNASPITDGTCTWYYIAAGSAAVAATWIAEETGAVGALAGTLIEIDTPVSGWTSVVNPIDASVGNDVERDATFRARRDAELATPGNTTVDTIRANVLKVNEGSTDPDHEPPTSCLVFYNDTDSTDANGLPPHSIEVLVQDGTTADIAQAIWDSVGAGTATYGTTTANVTDSEGNTQTVRFTRPTEIQIVVSIAARYDAAQWPTTGADSLVAEAVKSAFLTAVSDWPIARDVRLSPLIAGTMRGPSEVSADGDAVVPADDGADPVTGLLEVDITFAADANGDGFADTALSTSQIGITRRQVATFPSTLLTVTAASEDP